MVTAGNKNKLNKCVLIGRCDHDSTVRFPFYWAEEIILKAKEKGFNVIDLQGNNFIEAKFTKHVSEQEPGLIFLNGHGDEICAMGYNDEPVVILNKNDYLFKNKIVHIISCKTALLLGQFAKDKGCKGYLGYEGLFYIKNIHPEPHLDTASKMFMDAVNSASKVLLEGGSVEEAFLKSQKSYEKSINTCKEIYFNSTLSDSQRDFMGQLIESLEENKRNMVFI